MRQSHVVDDIERPTLFTTLHVTARDILMARQAMLHLRNYVSALYVATSVRPVFRPSRAEYISFASQASDVAGPWAATANVELAALVFWRC